jgi:hypothetical protein
MAGLRSWRRAGAAILARLAGATVVLLTAAVLAHGQANRPSDAEKSKALAAWDDIVAVLRHPRCLNCHQENVPLQGDKQRIHIPLVVRGPGSGEYNSQGVSAMRCRNCHNASGNDETSGTPGGGDGIDRWRLAPHTMTWQGLSSAKLCEIIQDKSLNGNMDGPALIHHMDSSPLVIWGWEPGGDRKKVPMLHDDFIDQMKIWVAGGMACPP